jgi:hypothetical protein
MDGVNMYASVVSQNLPAPTNNGELMNMRNSVTWRSFLAVAFAAAAGWASGPGEATASLLTNGDFENGLTAWTFTGNGTTDAATLSSDTPSGVGSSADLDINTGTGLPWLIQDVAVTPGMSLIFTASVREVEPNVPDAWIAGQVWMLPPSLASILSSTALFFTNPEWETKTSAITVPAGATVARVLFTPQNPGFGVGRGQYRIDNVSLDIPEPTCVMLLGLAALGIPRRSASQRR